jgi:hypothetical protein
MRSYLPVILVLLAVFTAACIAYIAWELSSGKAGRVDKDSDPGDQTDAGQQ